MTPEPFGSRNGWALYQHRVFQEQFDALVADVETIAETLRGEEYEQHAKVRLLARIRKIILEDIPSDPTSKAYEQGNTLGSNHRHWRRAKFYQRFRLFFRFHTTSRIIVYAWVNDENSLRTRGARNDVYAEFVRRLTANDPPDDWDDLLGGSVPTREASGGA